MGKRALITGITGQDGTYLAKLLLDKGYTVFGTYPLSVPDDPWRLKYMGIFDKVSLLTADLDDSVTLTKAVQDSQPDEIYHLAAMTSPGGSFAQPVEFGESVGIGTTRLLEAVRQTNRQARIFHASSREMFGKGTGLSVNEEQPFHPVNPYAVAKLYAHWISRMYRETYGMYVCNGIYFNHESPIRSTGFVTRKITNAIARIALGLDNELRMGNTDAKIDWGYAPEYVEAAWRMLQQNEPDDYIIATNESHTVNEFIQESFRIAGLDAQKYLIIDKSLLRPSDINIVQGDYSKAKARLGWEPKVKFNQLVSIMIEADLQGWKRWKNGEKFAWDAVEKA